MTRNPTVVGLEIDALDVGTRQTALWDVEWSVSDPDGDLATVTSKFLDGSVIDDGGS